MYFLRGEDGAYTTMFDTGIAISGISCVEFITGRGSTLERMTMLGEYQLPIQSILGWSSTRSCYHIKEEAHTKM